MLLRKLSYSYIRATSLHTVRHYKHKSCLEGATSLQAKPLRMEFDNASVRVLPKEDELKISFFYNGERKDLNRKIDDSLEKTLQRIALKIQPKAKKKNKRVAENPSNVVHCSVFDGSVEVSKDFTNKESFLNGRVLKVNEKKYLIHVNPPMVTKLELQNYLMAGFPTIPKVTFEFASMNNSKFSWFKSKENVDEWISVGDGPCYTPSVSDIDHRLRCVCIPSYDTINGPFSEEVISEELVKAGPGVCLFDQRHLLTPTYFPHDGSVFRMMTYNILANVFADSDYAKDTLFPFCPPYAIKSDYRRQLLFKELIGYHSDLICLQECSLHEYENYLYNWMSLHGYEGYLKLKLGEMSEGEAFFFRKEKYNHVEDLSVSITDALYMSCNADLLEKISSIGPLLENILSKKAVGQIHLLQEKGGGKRNLLVLNTHLYFKRYSIIIRLLQISILMNYISDILKQHDEDISVIVSGDLNSLQGEPLLQYLMREPIEKGHTPVNPDEEGLRMETNLKCPLELVSLSGFPDFTSYVPHCRATLDYIFGDPSIAVDRFIPLPSASEIDIYVGVPCVVYPSDHLAVVLDLKWK